jgi:hypothetical protein
VSSGGTAGTEGTWELSRTYYRCVLKTNIMGCGGLGIGTRLKWTEHTGIMMMMKTCEISGCH